jgi:hypothetical protein
LEIPDFYVNLYIDKHKSAKMTATKVHKSFQTITPFAGVNFINNKFIRSRILQLIEKQPGSVEASYSALNIEGLTGVSLAYKFHIINANGSKKSTFFMKYDAI